MEKIELVFGNKYHVTRVYKKASYRENHRHQYGYVYYDINPFNGIYIGKRVIHEGFTDEGVFCAANSITCYLFAKNKKALAYVPIDDVSVREIKLDK